MLAIDDHRQLNKFMTSPTHGEQHPSALDRVTITRQEALERDADSRRSMVEVFSDAEITISDTKFLEILPPGEEGKTVIGGHWEQGLEIQYVLWGRIACLDLADVVTRQEKSIRDIEAGSRIMLPSGVAHRLIFEEAALLLVCNEVPYTPDKCVVYPYKTPLPDGKLNLTAHEPRTPLPDRALPELP